MIPTTRFIDYDVSEALKMSEIINDFFPVFEECSSKLQLVHERKVKVVKDTTLPNDIYINPSIKVEFIKLQEAKMPVHLIIDKYDEWFDELFRLVHVNEGWLHHKAVFKHVTEILAICATFEYILEYAKQGFATEDE